MIKESKQWFFVKLICRYLITFALIDFAIQIICQNPYMSTFDFKELLGVEITWVIDDNTTLE